MFGINFLSPLFLIGAIAAAIPILLHLFHRKTEVVVDFPTVRLLARAPVQQHRRRRLRELVLLALRVLALVVLALSFARPYFAGASAPESAPLTVIAVDTSMSMTAPGQFDRARQAAARAAASAPSSHAVTLLAFADAASVVVEPTRDRAAIDAALAQLTPGTGGTRYRSALARASEIIGAREASVTIVTDLQQVGWESNDDGGLPEGVDVEVISVGAPAGNVALTSASRQDGRVVAALQNFSNVETRTPVTVIVQGKEIARTEAALAAMGAANVVLNASLPNAGVAEVRIDDARGYQGDNVKEIRLEVAAGSPVAIVVADPTGATGGLYLERALSVAGNGREFDVDVRDGRDVGKWTADEIARMDAIFIVGTRTLDRSGRELLRHYLTGGGRVLVATGPEVDLGTLRDIVGVNLPFADAIVKTPGATMIATDNRHPIFRPFLSPSGALGDVQVQQHRRLMDQRDMTVLARFSGGDPALVEQSVGDGRLLVFTSDLDNAWSRFPLDPAFVPFAVEAARYLTRGASAAGRQEVVKIEESNPAAVTVEEFTNAIERTSRSAIPTTGNVAREAEDRQRWWQIGLVVMLMALAGEALLGRRAT